MLAGGGPAADNYMKYFKELVKGETLCLYSLLFLREVYYRPLSREWDAAAAEANAENPAWRMEDRQVRSHGLAAATAVENPYCSCKR